MIIRKRGFTVDAIEGQLIDILVDGLKNDHLKLTTRHIQDAIAVAKNELDLGSKFRRRSIVGCAPDW